MKKSRFMICLFFLFLSLFIVSCDNSSLDNSKGQIEIIQDPVIEEVEEVDGIRVISTTNVKYFMYSMIPQWESASGISVAGSTANLECTVEGNTYTNYKIVNASTDNLGYFSQGKWHLTLYILDENQNFIVADPVIDQDYYLNTISSTISFNLDDLLFSSTQKCTIKINNLKFELVQDSDMYGVNSYNGFVLDVSLKSLKDNSVNFTKTISKDNLTFEQNTSGKNVVGVVNNFVVNDVTVSSGSYVVSILLKEHNGTEYIEAGGLAFSFYAGRETCEIISTTDSIMLYPSDYVTPGTGESGIIIDSGTNATVTIDTDLTASSTVTDKTAVTFTGEVNGKATSGQWFVNGESKSSGSTFSYTPSGMSGKTVTITYMILDSSYNTISANYYLTVSSS